LGKQWCWGWKNEAINAGLLKLECTSLINKKHYPQTLPTPALTSPSLLQVLLWERQGQQEQQGQA